MPTDTYAIQNAADQMAEAIEKLSRFASLDTLELQDKDEYRAVNWLAQFCGEYLQLVRAIERGEHTPDYDDI